MNPFKSFKKEYYELQAAYNKLAEDYNLLVQKSGDINHLTTKFNNLTDDYNTLYDDYDKLQSDMDKLIAEEAEMNSLLETETEELKHREAETRKLIDEKTRLEQDIASLIVNAKKDRDQAMKLSGEVKHLTAEKDKLEALITAYSEDEEKTRRSIEEKKDLIKSLNEEIEDLRQNKEKYSNVAALKIRYDQEYVKVDDIQKKHDRLQNEVSGLDELKKHLVLELNELQTKLVEGKTELEKNILQRKADLENEYLRTRERIEKDLSEKKNELTYYDRKVQEAITKINNANVELDKVLTELRQNEDRLKSVSSDRKQAEEEFNKLRSQGEILYRRIELMKEEYSSLTKQLERLTEEKAAVINVVNQLRGNLSGFASSKDALNNALITMANQINDREKQFREIMRKNELIYDETESRKTELNELKNRINLRHKRLVFLQQEIEELERRKENFNQELVFLTELHQKLISQSNDSELMIKNLLDTVGYLRRQTSLPERAQTVTSTSFRKSGEIEREYEELSGRYEDDDKAPGLPAPPEPSFRVQKEEKSPDKNRKYKILIADDNEGSRVLLARFLNDNDFMCGTVADGFEAFEELTKNKYDLILVDLNMPRVNGLEFIERIRRSKQYQEIPIIAVTGFNIEGLREKTLSAGANDIEFKPIQKDILLKKIRNLLTL